jgi:hypothetical protein
LLDTANFRQLLFLADTHCEERILQTRDELTSNIEAQYADSSHPASLPRPFPITTRAVAVVAAWLVPGAGHFTLGCRWRALLFFVLIVGSFVFGLGLHGRLYWPVASESPSAFHFDLITVLWTVAQIGSGLSYILAYALGIGTTPHPEAQTYEYGNTFMFLAGLLNYLVILDAFDIAAGRKR